jgi:UDP-2,3-diacylglucosamine hydrolase
VSEEQYLGDEKEWLLIYSREMLQQKPYNFLVFGHRHLPIDYRLNKDSRYINLGDWITFCTYAVFDGNEMHLRAYTGKEEKIYRN